MWYVLIYALSCGRDHSRCDGPQVCVQVWEARTLSPNLPNFALARKNAQQRCVDASHQQAGPAAAGLQVHLDI